MTVFNPVASAFRELALKTLGSVDQDWSRGLSELSDEELLGIESRIFELVHDARTSGFNDVALMCHKLAELIGVAQLRLPALGHEIETLGALAINFALMLVRSRDQAIPGLDLPNFAAEIDSAIEEAHRLLRHEENQEHAEAPSDEQSETLGGRYDDISVASVGMLLETLALEPSLRSGLLTRWDTLSGALLSLEIVPMQERVDRYHVIAKRTADRVGNQVDLRADLKSLVLLSDQARLMDIVLVELIENAVEHGIERQRARTVVGKQPWGVVTVWARRDGDELIVEVQDDGRGIDIPSLRRKFPDITEQKLLDHITTTSFSTRPKSRADGTDGEGMTRVQQAVVGLRGSLSLRTTVSAGTTVELRIPAPERLVDVWLFSCDGGWFAVPASHDVHPVDGGGSHPLEHFGVASERTAFMHLEVVAPGGTTTRFLADAEPQRESLIYRCNPPAWHPAAVLSHGNQPVVFIRRPTVARE